MEIYSGDAVKNALDENKQDRERLVSDGLATVKEAAQFLALGRSKVYDELNAGRLVSCKIGGARRIPWRALRDFARDSLMLAI
jgi:excisionase family DNA binding protein